MRQRRYPLDNRLGMKDAARVAAVLSSLFIILLFAIFVLPGLSLLARPAALTPVALFYAAVFLVLGGYHIGLPQRAQPDLLRPAPTFGNRGGDTPELCGRLLAQASEAGFIVDRPNAHQIRVDRDYWGQLPDQVKQAITACLRAPSRSGAQPRIEIVEMSVGR